MGVDYRNPGNGSGMRRYADAVVGVGRRKKNWTLGFKHAAVVEARTMYPAMRRYVEDGGLDIYFVGGPLWQDALGLYWIKGIEVRTDLFACLAHSALGHELTHYLQPGIDAEHKDEIYWGLGGINHMASEITREMMCGEGDTALAAPYDPNNEGCVVVKDPR